MIDNSDDTYSKAKQLLEKHNNHYMNALNENHETWSRCKNPAEKIEVEDIGDMILSLFKMSKNS